MPPPPLDAPLMPPPPSKAPRNMAIGALIVAVVAALKVFGFNVCPECDCRCPPPSSPPAADAGT